MSNRNTFRRPRRPRRVNNVRHIIRSRNRQPSTRLRINPRIINLHHRHTTATEPLTQRRRSDHHHRRRISQHELNPSIRMGRINRQIRRPRLQHTQNRHNRIRRPAHHQADTLTRPSTILSQQVRQPIRRLIQLPIRQRTTLKPHRHRIRRTRNLHPKQRRNRRLHHRPQQHRPMTNLIQPRTISSIKHTHRRQPLSSVSRDRRQYPLQPLYECANARRVEHVRAELHHATDPGRSAGIVEAFSQREHQIHTGRAGLRIQRCGLDITQAQTRSLLGGEVLP
ncbi:Uncharacterised protein [Mycolicibacterium fortuitum]|uniref:Uncharacterized protein n=1 Tax=Mycolicibacterium fortuitum TaxID=1766 RepID=A0A378V1G1_MYCFO|nr:Uncharacterised protein [Mycolicibacterium fortuitum]